MREAAKMLTRYIAPRCSAAWYTACRSTAKPANQKYSMETNPVSILMEEPQTAYTFTAGFFFEKNLQMMPEKQRAQTIKVERNERIN